jgi:hypothetical protein
MAAKTKLQGILSLSAASTALFQSVISTKADGMPTEYNEALNGQIISKTDKVILEPPHQKELLRLYAGHSSHASHSSHVSGTSVSSPDSGYAPSPSVPDTTPSTPANPTYTQPIVVPSPPIKSVVQTNYVTVTNEVSVTNEAGSQVIGKNDYVEFLKKDAAKGSSSSQYALALYYIHGEAGCETNVEKAKMLLELSAIQGNDDAKKRLEKLEADQKSEGKK